MTLDHAAQAAADREVGTKIGLNVFYYPYLDRQRDLYLRAFRQGAQWQQTQENQEDTRVDREALGGEPLTAAKDTAG